MKADRQRFLSTVAEHLCADTSGKQIRALALVDLTELQQINQSYGYSTVDTVLEELFQRLIGITKNPDQCCRIDGDKFALLLTPLLNIQLAPLLANKIIEQVTAPFRLCEPPVHLRANLGFAVSNRGGAVASMVTATTEAEQLLLEAESAAKIAKQRGDQYAVSETALFTQQSERLALQNEIADVLINNDFELYYQPKLNLVTKQPSGAEGLIRWDKIKSLGLSSEQLIAIIERSGHMLDLFRWTINTALRQSAHWPDNCGKLTVAINLSASCLKYDAIFHQIESSLNLWGVGPSQLCIEVTESAVQQDMRQGFNLLNKIKQLGVSISIDDFGTGYSSLEYFKYIPANELKIDKSFVGNMLQAQIDMEIVKLILEWGRRFNLSTVAEGIETPQALHTLQQLSCDFAQGYHISKALPDQDFTQWVKGFAAEAYFKNS